jgi:hypothetical protein
MTRLRGRIERLEFHVFGAPTDDADVTALARRRREEALGLERWYALVRERARALGEDPEKFLCRTRRRLLEEKLGPPVGRYELREGRIHIVPLQEGDEEDERITLVYRDERRGNG